MYSKCLDLCDSCKENTPLPMVIAMAATVHFPEKVDSFGLTNCRLLFKK
jgi:hypothetical protein